MNEYSYQEYMTIVEKHQYQLPIDVYAIANELKMKVYNAENWPNELSGKIIKDAQNGGISGYAIFVNKTHSPERRRFTIAHEIAHFILHRELIGDGIVDDALYRSQLSNSQEVMANKLAADILMPWNLINLKIQEGCNTVEKLAKKFEVSSTAMAIRLGIPSN